jgi:hypothetical protein
MSKADDPRAAQTLDEAARNPDGTYNGLRALSWLSEVLNPGKGLPEDEVAKIAADVKRKKGDASQGEGGRG